MLASNISNGPPGGTSVSGSRLVVDVELVSVVVSGGVVDEVDVEAVVVENVLSSPVNGTFDVVMTVVDETVVVDVVGT